MGYQVEVVRRDKWRKDQDFFGLWDLICVGANDIRFVQVKTNQKPDREWYEKEARWRCPSSCVREICIYKDYQKGGDVPANRITLEPRCSVTALNKSLPKISCPVSSAALELNFAPGNEGDIPQ